MPGSMARLWSSIHRQPTTAAKETVAKETAATDEVSYNLAPLLTDTHLTQSAESKTLVPFYGKK